ncbi:hypothetical protein [Halorubrum lipolyticum]|uniref:Uncharacterized protein n=1 Tax=Halorubrum lipolyticum DSM 21995 TaxID=1227482 RepID=M0P2E5_9EURY|nr:hypothetical protein [Halorubrum lipolyticum]EMA63704.1 hypothetical protein C469_02576 [Halorubrum lipolyticum DSM 21995]
MGQDARATDDDAESVGETGTDPPAATAERADDGATAEPAELRLGGVVHELRAPGADGEERATVAGYDPAVVLDAALGWARDRDYAGYDPYDGLNSPILSAIARRPIARLVAIHGVQASPVNLRPALGVPRERNPKGIGLFATAYLNRYELTGDRASLAEAERLLDWLAEHTSEAFDRPSWGYNFDWQNSTKFFLPAGHPCGVVTVFCARAFLRHHRLTGSERSLSIARGAASFLLEDLETVRVGEYDALSYTPYDSYVAVNANALAGDHLLAVADAVGDDALRDRGERLVEFVIDEQTEEGGWHYSVPASDSHLGYDNFHTGFVLESLSRYAEGRSPDHPARRAYERGMAFHREHHFEPDGAPKFEHDRSHPYDAHAAAQALITFTRRDDPADREVTRRVLGWSLEHLYDPDGYFYRRIGRALTDRTPYIRWSQAWMCLALSEYLLRTAEDRP